MNGMIQKYFLRYEPGFSPLFEMCVILGYMGHDRYPSQLRVSCLQLIVILLPICQLSVHCPLSSPPAPVIVAAVKLLSGAASSPLVTLALGPNTRTPETISICLCILFIRNIPCRYKPNYKCLPIDWSS